MIYYLINIPIPGWGRILWNVVLYSTNMNMITMLVRTVIMYYWHYYVLLSGLGVSDIYTNSIFGILHLMRDFHQSQTSRSRDKVTNSCKYSNIRFCASHERQIFIQVIHQLKWLSLEAISPLTSQQSHSVESSFFGSLDNKSSGVYVNHKSLSAFLWS